MKQRHYQADQVLNASESRAGVALTASERKVQTPAGVQYRYNVSVRGLGVLTGVVSPMPLLGGPSVPVTVVRQGQGWVIVGAGTTVAGAAGTPLVTQPVVEQGPTGPEGPAGPLPNVTQLTALLAGNVSAELLDPVLRAEIASIIDIQARQDDIDARIGLTADVLEAKNAATGALDRVLQGESLVSALKVDVDAAAVQVAADKVEVNQAKTDAQAAATAAAGSEQLAAGHVSDAENWALAANSEYLTARAMIGTTLTGMNARFEKGWLGWSYNHQRAEGYNTSWSYMRGPATGDFYGYVTQGSSSLYGQALVPLRAGQHWQLHAEIIVHEGQTDKGANTTQTVVGVAVYDAQASWLGNVYVFDQYLSDEVQPPFTRPLDTADIWETFPSATHIVPCALLNFWQGSGAQSTGSSEVRHLELVDITDSTDAKGYADAAAGTLTTVNAKVTAAENAASSATSMKNAAESLYVRSAEKTGNGDFEDGLINWTSDPGGGLEGGPQLEEGPGISLEQEPTGRNAKIVEFTWGNQWIYQRRPIPIDPTRTYRVRFRVKQLAGTGTVYAGVACLDQNYTVLTEYPGSHRYCAVQGVLAPQGVWTTYEGLITGEGPATNKFMTGTKYVRPMFIVNYDGGAGDATQVDFLDFEDVTESEKARLHAVAASDSADLAGTKAGEAGASAYAASLSETNAATSAGNASTSAGQASQSANDATGAANLAKAWMQASATTAAGAFRPVHRAHATQLIPGWQTARLDDYTFEVTPVYNTQDSGNVYFPVPEAQRVTATAMQARVFVPSDVYPGSLALGAVVWFENSSGYTHMAPILPGGVNASVPGVLPLDTWVTLTFDFANLYLEGQVDKTQKVTTYRLSVLTADANFTQTASRIKVEWIALGHLDGEPSATAARVDLLANDLQSKINLQAEYQRTPVVDGSGTLTRRLQWSEGPLLTNSGRQGEAVNHGWTVTYPVNANEPDPWFSSENFPPFPYYDAQMIEITCHWTGPALDCNAVRLHFATDSGWNSNRYFEAHSPEGPTSTRIRIPSARWFTLRFSVTQGLSDFAAYAAAPVWALRLDLEGVGGAGMPAGTFYIKWADLYTLDNHTPRASKAALDLIASERAAEATLKVQNGNVVAGIGLRADPTGSAIGFLADKLFVTNNATAAGAYPFTVQNDRVKINGELIVAGSYSLINNITRTRNATGWIPIGQGSAHLTTEPASKYGLTGADPVHSLRLYYEGSPSNPGAGTGPQFQHEAVRIDPRKTYEFSCSMFYHYHGDATSFFGLWVMKQDFNAAKLRVYNLGSGTFEADGHWMELNPYFWYEHGSWANGGQRRDMRGYLVPWDTDPATIPRDGKCTHAFFMPPDANWAYPRFLNLYATAATALDIFNVNLVETSNFTQIDGGSIKTGVVAAERLAIQTPNIVLNPGLNDDAQWGGTKIPATDFGSGGGSYWARWFVARDFLQVNWVNIQPGETYEIEASLAGNGNTNAYALNIGMHMVKPDGTNHWASAVMVPAGTLPDGSWKRYNGRVTVPPGFTQGRFWINQDAYSGFSNIVVAGVQVRRGGTAISGDQVRTGTIQSNAVDAGGNPVSMLNLNDGSFRFGRTGANEKRIEYDTANGLRVFGGIIATDNMTAHSVSNIISGSGELRSADLIGSQGCNCNFTVSMPYAGKLLLTVNIEGQGFKSARIQSIAGTFVAGTLVPGIPYTTTTYDLMGDSTAAIDLPAGTHTVSLRMAETKGVSGGANTYLGTYSYYGLIFKR